MSKRPLLFLLCFLLASPAWAQEVQRTITVTGQGMVTAAPDRVSITVGVEETRPLAADALRSAAEQAQAIFAVLDAEGITGPDRQTTAIGLSPVWSRVDRDSSPQVTGYSASTAVLIRVSEIDRLGAVLDTLGQAGANRIQAIRFELSESAALEGQARAAAVADARARAELYAGAAGVSLGPVLEIMESGGGGGPVPLAMERMAVADAMTMPVAEGELTLTASVVLRFAIE